MAEIKLAAPSRTPFVRQLSLLKEGLSNVLLGFYALLTLYPLIWLFLSAFKTNNEIYSNPFSFPQSWHFENIARAWEISNMGRAMFNSLFVSVVTLLITLILGALTAYAVSRFQFRFKGTILGLLLLGMLIPVHSTLVPLFIMLNRLNLLDTYWALILPYFAFELSLTVFILAAYMSGLPRELEEAATIDGSGYWGIFLRIMFPLSMPALSTVAIIGFLRYWNEFAFALVFINDSALKTLPLSLAVFSNGYSTNYSLTLAAMAVSVLPVIILFIFLQDRIMQGMVAGAVKG
jgi:raffinose/stachyose/melibiose transport system permease protein